MQISPSLLLFIPYVLAAPVPKSSNISQEPQLTNFKALFSIIEDAVEKSIKLLDTFGDKDGVEKRNTIEHSNISNTLAARTALDDETSKDVLDQPNDYLTINLDANLLTDESFVLDETEAIVTSVLKGAVHTPNSIRAAGGEVEDSAKRDMSEQLDTTLDNFLDQVKIITDIVDQYPIRHSIDGPVFHDLTAVTDLPGFTDFRVVVDLPNLYSTGTTNPTVIVRDLIDQLANTIKGALRGVSAIPARSIGDTLSGADGSTVSAVDGAAHSLTSLGLNYWIPA